MKTNRKHIDMILRAFVLWTRSYCILLFYWYWAKFIGLELAITAIWCDSSFRLLLWAVKIRLYTLSAGCHETTLYLLQTVQRSANSLLTAYFRQHARFWTMLLNIKKPCPVSVLVCDETGQKWEFFFQSAKCDGWIFHIIINISFGKHKRD